jgi:hypothetical protein
MRFTRSSILAALIGVAVVSATAGAQHRGTHRWETGPSRFSLEGDLLVAQPKGEFATQIDTQGFGGNIGGMQYGSETLHAPYLPITGRVSLDVETTNSVFWGAIGPQISAPVGRFQPYLNASVGFMDFVTQTSVRGSDSDYEYASTTNKDDATSTYIFGGGVYIPIGNDNQWKFHAGARYFMGGTASYLKEGDIRDNPDGSITLFPRTSKTDQVTWQVGMSYTFPLHRRR